MHALRLVAALSLMLCGVAHAQQNLPSASGQVGIGSACTLTDGRRGVCKKTEQCLDVIEELQKGIQPTTCFFDDVAAIPCCPVNELSSSSTPEITSTVTTPSRPTATTTRGPTQGQQVACHDPVEDWSPSPEEEHSLLQLAQQKCVEYRQYVYHLLPSPTVGMEFINTSICGMEREPLIVGEGAPASPGEFPHMAVIGFGDGRTTWDCGGSLISSRHILTTAVCVTSPVGCARWVLLGAVLLNATNTTPKPQKFNIVRRLRHPGYNPPKHYNNIAILELDRDVSITGFVRPACLYDAFAPPEFENGISTGFGRKDWLDTELSNTLMKVTMPFQPFSQCNGTYRVSFKLPNGIDDNGMLCAGDLRGNQLECQRDFGGPLQVRDIEHCMYKIIGVSAFGPIKCGGKNAPVVYTRVSSYIPWIAKVVWA